MINNYIVNLLKTQKMSIQYQNLLNIPIFEQKTNFKQTTFILCKTFTFNNNILKYGLLFYFCNYIIFLFSFSAFGFTIDTKIVEGSLIRGTQIQDETLYLGQTKIPVGPNGTFYFGLPQDAVSPLKLKKVSLSETKEYTFPIQKRKWEEQRINGLSQSKVKINPENQKRIKKENTLLRFERVKTILDFFPTCFVRPVKQPYRISGAFGNRRIFNNQVPAGHSGTDYAAPKGTPVYAIADGVVAVTHPDMFLSGQTILINHGYGIFAAYSHLSKINVKNGQWVKQNQPIGQIGATGRATGPHLHFTLTWYTTRVDPEQVLTDFACQN